VLKLFSKFDQDRSIRWWDRPIDNLANFSKGMDFQTTHQRERERLGQTAPDLGRTKFHHRYIMILWFGNSNALLRFEMRAVQRRVVSKIEAKFYTFWIPVKIRGGMGRMLGWRIEYTLRPNLWYLMGSRCVV